MSQYGWLRLVCINLAADATEYPESYVNCNNRSFSICAAPCISSIIVNLFMTYFFFYLELSLKDENDLSIYAFENVSHIPTSTLVEIFEIDLARDPNIIDGYVLTEKMAAKHAHYIKDSVGPINLRVFDYCLRQYASDKIESIRKLYKESLME